MVKNPPANLAELSSIPGLGRSLGEGNGNPLQYSCLENPIDREGWKATVHWISKNWTQIKGISTHAHIASKFSRSLEIMIYNI